MKKILLMTCLFAIGMMATAQTENKERKEYRFKKNSGKLILDVGRASVEGYRGNEVIISKLVEAREVDERAAGLQGINSSGLRDNTGVGLYLKQDGNVTEIRLINPNNADSIHIQVPQEIALSIQGSRNFINSGLITAKNFEGELEISNNNGDVKLNNVTGPMTIKTVHGNIESVFSAPVKGPVSILSSYGLVDIAIPTKTHADIELSSNFGELFAAEEFNINVTQPEKSTTKGKTIGKGVVMKRDNNASSDEGIDLSTVEAHINKAMEEVNKTLSTVDFSGLTGTGFTFAGGANRVQGTINGGGEKIILRATHGNIYLRTTEK